MERLMNYREFLSEYVYRKFGYLDRDIVMRDLGINNNTDSNTFDNARENIAKTPKKNANNVINLINKIENITTNEVLLRELLGRIIFICSYGRVVEAKDSFRGIYQDKNNTYSVEIYLHDNKISVYTKNNSSYSNIVYERKNGEFTIMYDIKNQTIFGDSNLFYEDVYKKIVKNYDNNGRQVSELYEKKKENYSIDKNTGDKVLPKPCVFKNFTNKKYTWRDGDYILMREEEKHVLDDSDDEFIKSHDGVTYYIGKDDKPENVEMKRSKMLWGIYDDDLNLYENGSLTSEELYNKTRPRHKSTVIMTI